MAQERSLAQLREELVDAFERGEEERARALVSRLASESRRARATLDEMLASADAGERRAAVFGFGELGGVASLKRLEKQMVIEESRGDNDAASVLEVITRALGRIKEADARASLIRRLQRLIAGQPGRTDVSEVAYALWRKRHPDLIPVVRSALKELPANDSWALRALLLLLETPPRALAMWAMDVSVSPGMKADVMAILDEDVPDELLPIVPAFITAANDLGDMPVDEDGEASAYCNRLFTTLLLHESRILPALPPEARSTLHALARRCIASVDSSCALRAASMLQRVGRPEDVPLLEAHRPASPILGEVFDDAIRTLRKLPNA